MCVCVCVCRFTDFLVYEVGQDGETVRLKDIKGPQQPKREKKPKKDDSTTVTTTTATIEENKKPEQEEPKVKTYLSFSHFSPFS